MYKLSEIMLYPKKLHAKFTDSRLSLYAGIVAIGVADLFMPKISETFEAIFSGKSDNQILINLLVTIAAVLLLGISDVVIFSLPLYDFFKYIKKREGQPHAASAVKVMKVYVLAYFITLPVQLLLYYTVFSKVDEHSSFLLQNLDLAFFLVIIIWSALIITRGLNVLFNMNIVLKRLTFLIVFTWNMIIIVVSIFQFYPWIRQLFTLIGVKLPE